MFAKERHDKIFTILQQNGAVTTIDLMKTFQVSIETIRRDLLYMEQNMLLKRVHGGAVAITEMMSFHNLDYRVEENSDLKRALAQNAMQFIKEGDIICIDAGSTAITFSEVLKEHFSELTVITYSSDVFEILGKHKNFSVILCGGHFNKAENAFYGDLTLEQLGRLHMQKAFLCPAGVSLKFGICEFQQDFAQIQKKIIECSDSIYILADSSKFEQKALLKVSDMKPEFTYITDDQLSPDLKKIYRENQLNIITESE